MIRDGEPTAATVVRRPRRADAVRLARAIFLDGERVDMQALTSRLDIGRATLHRWVGTREQLLSEVLAGLATEFIELAYDGLEADGDERVLDFGREVMELTFRAAPVRQFVAREPQLALRLILAESGVVHDRLAQGLRRVLAETRPADEVGQLEGFVDTFVQVGSALEWATFAIGDRPQIERVIEIGRALLSAQVPATSRRRSTQARAPDGN